LQRRKRIKRKSFLLFFFNFTNLTHRMNSFKTFCIALLMLLYAFVLLTIADTLTVHAQAVTTLAGDGTSAFLDGIGTAAQFNFPRDVCSDGAGNLYIADESNHRIRRIVIATGVVTTLAGSGTAGSADDIGTSADFSNPDGVCTDGAGNLFVADLANNRIRQIVIATGVVSTLAGSTAGMNDGTGAAVQFNGPRSICGDGAGNLYVADQSNHRIRRIDIATGAVTTIAGSSAGMNDGIGTSAQFNQPYGVFFSNGSLFVTDHQNHCIRQINVASGAVTTLAGSTGGYFDAIGTLAQFNLPCGICGDGMGNLFVVDAGNQRIRRIIVATGEVTTIAGSVSGYIDAVGTSAQFTSPRGICLDGNRLFVVERTIHRIRQINLPSATSSASYTGTTFPEAAANDGSITTTQDVTLSGEMWLPAGAFTAGTDFTAAGVPAGLTLAVNTVSTTVARISFTGNAAAHAALNSTAVTLNFANAALASANAGGVTGLNPAVLNVNFTNPPTAAYSGTTFPEVTANDGSITQTRTITLTGETWNTGITNGTNFTAGTHFTAANVPAGLTIQIQKTSANVAMVGFTGNATAHTNANDVANVQITWLAAATQNVLPANITGLNGVNLTLDFNDPGGVTWSGTTFTEAAANNGSIPATRTVSLTPDTWNTAIANGSPLTVGTHYTVANVPAGLTMAITKNSISQVTISFAGNATSHANANDVSNVQITFLNAAVSSGNASGNAGLNGVNLTLDFNDPYTAAYSGMVFSESVANDGSITATQDVTLSGDTWLPAGAFTAGTHFTAAGVPAGLTLAVNALSTTVARISFMGNAAAHATVNFTAVTLNFTNAAVASGNAGGVTGLNGQALSISFIDATPPTAFTASLPPVGLVGAAYGYTFAANGSPAPTYTLASGSLPSGLALNGSTGALTGTPAAGTGGVYSFTLTATNAGGSFTSAPIALTINQAPASFSAAAPSVGMVGTAYNYSFVADGFPAPTYSVFSGTLPAGLTLSAATGLLSGTPTAAGTFGPIIIRASNGFGNVNAPAFTLAVQPAPLPPPPPPPPPPVVLTITGFSPSSGGDGTVISIRGMNLRLTRSVSIGGQPATNLQVVGDTLVLATVNGGRTGQIQIVSTENFIATSPEVFTYIPPPVPQITSFGPNMGGYQTIVSINGQNFRGAQAVFFGGFPALSFIVESDNLITATVGAGVAGTVDVTVVNANGRNGYFGFTYTTPPTPRIVSINGMSINGVSVNGTTSTISFPVSDDEVQLRVVATGVLLPGAQILVDSSAVTMQTIFGLSETYTLRIPAQAQRVGSSLFRIINPDGQTTSATLTMTSPAAPQILAFTPSVTTASFQAFTVNLAGTGFFRAASIRINGMNSTSKRITSSTSASLAFTAEDNRRAGTFVLRLTNPDGQFTEATVRVQNPLAPQILNLSVRANPQANPQDASGGSILLVVDGKYFGSPAMVILSGVGLRVLSASATQLVAVIPRELRRVGATGAGQPAGSPPAVVVVQNPDGQADGRRWYVEEPAEATMQTTMQAATEVTMQAATQAQAGQAAHTDEEGMSNNVLHTALRLHSVETIEATVYPNPTETECTVAALFPHAALVQATLRDALGKRIWQANERVQAGVYRTTIDVRGLAAGVYFLELHDGTTLWRRAVLRR
jgi:sugar lactone lactonase YvrE